MKTSLVWFKNDLRLHDNEALSNAIANSDTLVFCYCLEPYLFQETELGFKKAGVNRLKFLKQSVTNLRTNLEAIGGHLIISEYSADVTIPKLIERYNIKTVYAETEYASEELKLVNSVKGKLPDTEFISFWGKTLYHIDDIPFTIDTIPLTSKAYRIPATKQSAPRIPFKPPVKVNGHPKAKSTSFPSYKKLGFKASDWKTANPIVKGGEDEGLKRLQFYSFESELLTSYRWTRNRSLGMDYSSKFSPYLALGCLSAREIFSVVKRYETEVKKNQSTWWLIFELVWRDYFTFKGMRFGDAIFKTEGFKGKEVDFENDLKKFQRWMEGQTGIPFIDAHMRQLNETGFMSNRGRVNCSSYFVHDLKIDWTWGAAYFESKLIDYDVSANWLNWHVQAYEIWYTNPVHQSNKYKSQEFIRKWIPELRKLDDVDILVPWETESTDYPKPIEIYKKWTRAINLIKKEKESK